MTTMPKASVNAQPSNLDSMDLYQGYHTIPNDEKHAHRYPHNEEYLQSEYSNEQCESSHKGCHGSRLRRIVLPALIISLILSALLAITCMDTGDLFGLGMDGLARRATGDTTEDGPFVDNKLYLIVIFVGLLVVVILAIMLSAWCCKGAFQNPLCCPCYLCACCGGLACLECIGCGLCAEGLEEA